MLFLTSIVVLTLLTKTGAAFDLVATVKIEKPYIHGFYELFLDLDAVSNIQPNVPDDEIRALELTVTSVSSEIVKQIVDIRIVRCDVEILATKMRAFTAQLLRFENPWIPIILNGTGNGTACSSQDARMLKIYVLSSVECQMTFSIEKVISENPVPNVGFPTRVQFNLPPVGSRLTVPIDGLFKNIAETSTMSSVRVLDSQPVRFKIGICGSVILELNVFGSTSKVFSDTERRAISLMRNLKCRTWDEDLTAFYVETVSGHGVVSFERDTVEAPKLLELLLNDAL